MESSRAVKVSYHPHELAKKLAAFWSATGDRKPTRQPIHWNTVISKAEKKGTWRDIENHVKILDMFGSYMPLYSTALERQYIVYRDCCFFVRQNLEAASFREKGFGEVRTAMVRESFLKLSKFIDKHCLRNFMTEDRADADDALQIVRILQLGRSCVFYQVPRSMLLELRQFRSQTGLAALAEITGMEAVTSDRAAADDDDDDDVARSEGNDETGLHLHVDEQARADPDADYLKLMKKEQDRLREICIRHFEPRTFTPNSPFQREALANALNKWKGDKDDEEKAMTTAMTRLMTEGEADGKAAKDTRIPEETNDGESKTNNKKREREEEDSDSD